MISISIEDLFTKDRFPKGWSLLPILLYFPIGVVLATIRFFIGLHTFLIACLLPKTAAVRSYILRTMCFVLGILVIEDSVKHKNKSAKIVVTNHVTILDHLAIDVVLPCTVPCVWDLPQVLTWCFGYKDFGIKQGRDVLIQNVQRHCRDSNLPILAHPEGATTSGTVGLLKFGTWPFCIGQPINPLILQAKRLSYLHISPTVIGSSWYSDLFWFLFSPCTTFTIKYLHEMRYDKEISVEDFTKQVQEVVANSLNIKATNYTCADKVEYLKKLLFNSSIAEPSSAAADKNSQLLTMVHQVKEVLPYVPFDAIKNDLLQTHSVSLTISNLLEGIVHYEPETELTNHYVSSSFSPTLQVSQPSSSLTLCSSPQAPNSVSDTDVVSPASMDMAAETFGKTASERMQSYNDRKQKLIDAARKRYQAKLGSS